MKQAVSSGRMYQGFVALVCLVLFLPKPGRADTCPRNRDFRFLWYRNGVSGSGELQTGRQAETFYDVGVEISEHCWTEVGYQQREKAGSFGTVTIVAPRPGCGASGDSVYGSLWVSDPDSLYSQPAMCPSCVDDDTCEMKDGCTCPDEPGCGAAVWPGRRRAVIGVYDPVFQSGQTGMKIRVTGGSADLLGPDGPIQVLAFNHFKYDMIVPSYSDRLLPGVNGPSILWDGRICVRVTQPIEKPVTINLHFTWSWGSDPDDYVEFDTCSYDPPKDTAEFSPGANASITILPNPDNCDSCNNEPPLPTPNNLWYIPQRATHCADFYMPPYWPVGGYQRWAACKADEVKLPQFSYTINAIGSDVSPVEFEWISDTTARAVVEDRVNGLLYEFRGQTRDVDGVSCRRYSEGEGMKMKFSRRWHREDEPSQSPMMMMETESSQSEYPGWVLDMNADFNTDGLPVNVHWVERPEARTWYDYDLFGRITKISAGGLSRNEATEVLTYGYSETGTLTQKSGCASCGGTVTSYEYDSLGRVTLRKDTQGQIIERVLYDYAMPSVPVTKVYVGNSTLKSESIYDIDETASEYQVTKKYYVSEGQARVRVEEHESSAFDSPIRVHLYTGLNGTGDRVSTDYGYEVDGSGHRATKYEQSHAGVKRLSYYNYGVLPSDANYGRVTKETIQSQSGGEIALSQHGYTKVTYGGTNQLAVENRTWNAHGGLTTYDYGDNGQLISQVEPEINGQAQRRGYEYDGRQRLTLEWRLNGTSENAKTTTFYSYDHADNLVKSIERYDSAHPENGLTTSYGYDIYNRQVLSTDPNGNSVTKEYAPGGALQWEAAFESGSSGSVLSEAKYEYDANGRMTRQIVADDQQSFGLHSPAGWITTRYVYDGLGRKTEVIEDEGGLNLVTRYEYNSQDEVVKTTMPGGVWTQIVRDGRGLQAMQIVGFEGSTTSQQMTTHYAYDADGNMVSRTSPAGAVTTYDYDGYGRRTKMTEH